MDGFMASAFAAFFGGALSFLSPCVLPLVPGYLCFAAGLQFSELSALEEKAKPHSVFCPARWLLSAVFRRLYRSGRRRSSDQSFAAGLSNRTCLYRGRRDRNSRPACRRAGAYSHFWRARHVQDNMTVR